MWCQRESEEAKKLLESGNTYKEISEKLGKTYPAIKQHLKNRYNIKQSDFLKRTDIFRKCKSCENSFIIPVKNKNKKYCSVSCANRGLNRWANRGSLELSIKKNEKSAITRIAEIKKCKNCNKQLDKKTVFCNNECYRGYYNDIQLEKIKNGDLKDTNRKTIKRILTLVRGHQCEICKNTEWNGKKIPITLDHIDGNSENNLESNFRLICPNCDAQLPTYKGGNKGNGRKWRKKYYNN
jgi:predicted transcriptional regulator